MSVPFLHFNHFIFHSIINNQENHLDVFFKYSSQFFFRCSVCMISLSDIFFSFFSFSFFCISCNCFYSNDLSHFSCLYFHSSPFFLFKKPFLSLLFVINIHEAQIYLRTVTYKFCNDKELKNVFQSARKYFFEIFFCMNKFFPEFITTNSFF